MKLLMMHEVLAAPWAGADPVVELSESFQEGLMASAERKPIMKVWGRA